jgi:hypothetical protein
MKTKLLIILVAIVMLSCKSFDVHAQGAEELLQRLMQEDKASIEALVLYPENTRKDILVASQSPELIVRISEMQKVTSQKFSDLLAPYSQADQAHFWEVARYPDLVSLIAKPGGIKETALKDFPESVQDDARWVDDGHRATALKMNELYEASQAALESLLRSYPPHAQQAFRNLVSLPEVMSILRDDLKMTVLVGDLYSRDPAWVSHKLDSLNLEVARRNAEDLEAWRDSLSANPQALQELEQSAEEFRQAQGEPEVTSQQVIQYTTVVNYQYNPYPWWYGYPAWYDYPYWYPQPYWYHWGYYYGPGGVIVVNWLPSPYFTHWYFYHPWHHHHYPHLTHHFLCYHEGHRNSPGGFHREVGNWKSENQNVFGRDWLRNDAERPDRIQEYGKFEVAYHNSVAAQPQKAITEQAYFTAHSKEYPRLKATVDASPRTEDGNGNAARPNEIWPTHQPNLSTHPTNQPKPTPAPNNVQQSKPKVEPRPKVQPNPPVEPRPTPKIERVPQNELPRHNPAPSYHRDTWQRVEPRPTYTPKPQVAPRPTFSPKQSVSPKSSMGPKGR